MENLERLTELRQQIDRKDKELVALLNERARLAQEIGEAKGGGPIYCPDREAKVIDNAKEHNKGPLSNLAVGVIFVTVVEVCRDIQNQDKDIQDKA